MSKFPVIPNLHKVVWLDDDDAYKSCLQIAELYHGKQVVAISLQVVANPCHCCRLADKLHFEP